MRSAVSPRAAEKRRFGVSKHSSCIPVPFKNVVVEKKGLKQSGDKFYYGINIKDAIGHESKKNRLSMSFGDRTWIVIYAQRASKLLPHRFRTFGKVCVDGYAAL